MPRTTVRPGEIMQTMLLSLGEMPMGELYQRYKRQVEDARGNSPTRMRQRIMSYDSWRKMIYFARQIGLIEVVARGEPVGNLVMIEPGGGRVVPSTPAILGLTAKGASATTEWDNLRKAYDLHRGAGPVVALQPTVPTPSLPENFSARSIPRIVMHLATLRDLAEAVQWPETPYQPLAAEAERIREVGEGWLERGQEVLETEEDKASPNDDRLEQLQARVESLTDFVNALEDENLEGAQDALEGL